MLVSLKSIGETKTYQSSVSPARLILDLEKIEEIDHLINTKIAEFRKYATRYFLGFIGLLGLFALILSQVSLSQIVMAIVFIFFGVLFMKVLMGYFKNNKTSNYYKSLKFSSYAYRYKFLKHLSRLLQKDMYNHQKVKISLDLSEVEKKAKFVRQLPYLKREDGKIDCYEDEFLKIKGSFVEGTKFFLHIIEYYQVRSWTNINGKHRVRHKHKGFDVILEIKYPDPYYHVLRHLGNKAQKMIQLPKTVILKRLMITPEKLIVKVKVCPDISSEALLAMTYGKFEDRTIKRISDFLEQTIIMMFLSCFQMINFARKITEHQTA